MGAPEHEGASMRLRRTRRLLAAGLGTLAVGSFALLAPAVASAQGSDYSHAQFQVTFSLNCDHASCAGDFGLGGEWGWIALTPGGGGQAQVTQCGHTVGGGGPGSAGAGHLAFDASWQEITSPVAPTPITPTDPNGNYLVISGAGGGFGLVVPATYGHYSVAPDGANGQITIAP